MEKRLNQNWRATTKRAESTHAEPIYVANECQHGRNAAHSLEEALGCGMLQAVRQERGLKRDELARRLSVHYNSLARWERGEIAPVGLYRKALEAWLLGRAQ